MPRVWSPLRSIYIYLGNWVDLVPLASGDDMYSAGSKSIAMVHYHYFSEDDWKLLLFGTTASNKILHNDNLVVKPGSSSGEGRGGVQAQMTEKSYDNVYFLYTIGIKLSIFLYDPNFRSNEKSF